jgi:hypothetical protein
MPRGGKQPGAGRPRDLPIETRETIAREYRDRMWAAAAVDAMVRDPKLQRRRAIDKQMRELAATHAIRTPTAEEDEEAEDKPVIRYHRRIDAQMRKLEAELGDKPYRVKPPTKRAKGYRDPIIANLANEYGVTKRMIVRCINEFDFGT